MNPGLQGSSGSVLWQIVFVSFAIILVLFEFIRGWRLGLMRQIARVVAIVAAYAAAIFGGKLLLPIARTFLRMPDPIIAMLAGAVLALLIYSVVSSLGVIFFKRTAQHGSLTLRFLCGVSGAALGLFFGVFFVWLMVVSVRSLGAVADGRVCAQAATEPADPPPAQAMRAILSSSPDLRKEEPDQLMALLARLKNSIELGSVGGIVKRTDLIPEKTYDMLAKVGQVLANPENAERFLTFPGARELSEHPKIVALRNDPEIADLIARGRIFDLLQNEKVLEAANDPALIAQIKEFDLRQAMDYALEQGATASHTPRR